MSIVTKTDLKAKYQTGDIPTQQDFIDFIDTVYPYEKYVALLTQSGTSAPTAVILENTLGATITWTYSAVGTYLATASVASTFTSNKTTILSGLRSTSLDLSTPMIMHTKVLTGTTFTLMTYDTAFAGANDILKATMIEIRVYP